MAQKHYYPPERIERAIANHDWVAVERLVDAVRGGTKLHRHVDDAITAAVHLAERGELSYQAATVLGLSGLTVGAVKAYVASRAGAK